MDDGDQEAFASCFTEDGRCEVCVIFDVVIQRPVTSFLQVLLTGTVKTGTEELKGLCGFLHDKFRTCRHWEALLFDILLLCLT